MSLFTQAMARFGSCRVLVLGDVMLDRYVWGEVKRISPEAPVPVVRVRERTEVLGGCGNVAANLAGLGCRVTLVSIRGADPAGERVEALLRSIGVESNLAVDPSRPTITKTRIMAQGQQLMRLDDEDTDAPASSLSDRIASALDEALPRCDALILSDYGKGTLKDRAVTQRAIALARSHSIPVLVDPKGKDWERYRGASCVTPNTAEFEAMSAPSEETGEAALVKGAAEIRDRFGIERLLVTRGPRGMCLVEGDGSSFSIPARAREVFDVSGAGDTVISTLAAGVAAGLGFFEAAQLANLAAGIVVGKLGTQPIEREELQAAAQLAEGGLDGLSPSKTVSVDTARILVKSWRASGATIVFTNGCFDLLHPGHVQLLNRARELGDRLVVGLNADSSIRRLKGAGRPILHERDRASLLAALSCVDLVVLFEEDTPHNLLSALRPDILAKGANYRAEEVVGREIVEEYGGRVRLVPVSGGHSTSTLIDSIRETVVS